MKKTLLILVVLALLAPSAALAATEFSLGGFIKLDSFWDSTQNPKTALTVIQRNNDQQFHHGHFLMTAQGSRFNFTIKGPKLWGATTSGLIEMDFDGSGDGRVSATSSYLPRLRHAMFRLNWPETELLFGQYWGMFSEYAPEAPGDADFANHGWFLQRLAQIRLTQKFLGAWTVAGAIMKPYDPSAADTNFANVTANPGQVQFVNPGLEGQASETPQLQGKIQYEKDHWGKAAFYGRPRGFVAQVSAGWQRTRYRANIAGVNLSTFGQNQYGFTGNVAANGLVQDEQQYLNPWVVQGTLFIPVLPTHSANLAGTASLSAQWFIGQGVSAFGAGRDEDNTWFNFSGRDAFGTFRYQRMLMQQYGGYVQAQYYFTNQWFLNLAWGMIRDYGINGSTSGVLAGQQTNNPAGYMYASNNDQVKMWSEYNLTLWYRPIEAFKFGLTYAFENTYFLQKLNNPSFAVLNNVPGQGQVNSGAKDYGESHRVQFVAFMYF